MSLKEKERVSILKRKFLNLLLNIFYLLVTVIFNLSNSPNHISGCTIVCVYDTTCSSFLK